MPTRTSGTQLVLFVAFFCRLTDALYAYPDPRTEPYSCKVAFAGPVCDPSEVISSYEREALADAIRKVERITANIPNASPRCAGQSANLEIMVALVEKPGPLMGIEEFAHLLRAKYLQYQASELCDTLVLIVASRTGQEVFTLAGRDALISEDLLQAAFRRNARFFRSDEYASGLEGMVEMIASAYSNAHLYYVPRYRYYLRSTPSGALAYPWTNYVPRYYLTYARR
ncbi:Protein F01D5.6 [Aphelenchoides avenae]|nr:Protein F01D5.6 [Aphelenchus avenae]